jgi:hypothetical protein
MRGNKATKAIHGALFGILVASAACGGAGVGAPPSQVPGQPSEGTAPSANPASGPEGTGPAPGASTASTPSLPPTPLEMKPIVPTAMVADLQALGLDAKSLPPIEKLEPRALRGVMKLMAKSLGIKCGDCHQQGDFAAPTRRKKIAAHMWDEFAAKMAFAEGAPPDAALFCDSCHQGRVQLLDRTDKKALSKWMDENFTGKLVAKTDAVASAGASGKAVECETCHVDMDMRFLAKWGERAQ